MSAKLFVANLSFDTTRQELERFFSSAGFDAIAKVPLDQRTGRPRGFAFVELSTREEAEEALTDLSGVELAGRPLSLQWAREGQNRNGNSRLRHAAADESGSFRATAARGSGGENSTEFAALLQETDDYVERHRSRQQRGGKHGSDRLHWHGTRRSLD